MSSPTRSRFFSALGLAAGMTLLLAAPAGAASPGDDVIAFTADDIENSSVSPDGSTIALSSYVDDTVTLIDTASGVATTMTTGFGGPGGSVFTPDGSTLYVANYDIPNIAIIDVATATVTGLISGVFSGPWVLEISPDGDTLYIGDYTSNNIFFNDISTAITSLTATVDISASTDGIYGMYLSADGSQIFGVDEDGSVVVVDVATESVVDAWNDVTLGNSYGGCVSPDGTVLYQPDSNDSALYSSSLATGAVLASNVATQQTEYGTHTDCAVSPDGSSVFVSHWDAFDPGVVTEYDATTLEFIEAHLFTSLDFTQQIVFYSACDAFVAGYEGGAQSFQITDGDCAPAAAAPDDSELAATGLNASTTAGAAALAGIVILAGAGALVLRSRRRAGSLAD